MAPEPLATVADLTALGIDTTNTALVGSLLASVSAAVRDAAGVLISRATSTITIEGTREQWLPLPGNPVLSVTGVELDGTTVTDHKLIGGRLWRPRGWQSTYAPSEVRLTLVHGYDPVPADIVKMVCTFVAAGIHEATEGIGANRGKSSERADDYQISFTRGEDEVVDMTELPQRTKDALRARFSGAVAVTGTY